MSTRWQHQVNKFASNDDGAVALLFGLMTFVLFFMGAIAVDYSRVIDMRSRIVSAVDAASLAAGRALLDGKLSDSEIVDLATVYFNENVKSAKKFGSVGTPAIKIDRESGAIDINVDSNVSMTLARVGGIDKMDIPVTSAATYKQKDIEVGMALDVTGSMNESVGGKRKIDALKSAFEQFADRLIPTQKSDAHRVRIGLAPYSSGINVGKFATVVTDQRSLDGCVTERRDGKLTDAAVTPAAAKSTNNPSAFLVKEDGRDDIDNSDGATPKNAFECPSSALVPLSEDRDALVQAVNSFQAKGWTAGHLGIQWAWNLVSDQWGGTFGGDSAADPYNRVKEEKLIKAVVLMTDGSFNTAYHGEKSANGNWSKTQAVKLCDAMKAAGKDVVVFSVAFNAPKDAQATLKACASSGDGYYANAESAEDLEAAFNSFAAKLTQLRISK
jgi:Flp pilus assembly protein TadG